MKVYKLTDANGRTHGGTSWGEGIAHEASGEGGLCGPGWLHFYTDPLLAILLNPIHADFPQGYRLWEAEAEGNTLMDYGLKGGCTRLTILREITPPTITTEQRVRFALLCVKQVYHNADWTMWADRWLSGEDRSKVAARAAEAEAWAAWAATREAGAAAREAGAAARAAGAAARAAGAATRAAGAAEAAAGAAEAAAREIDLIAITRKAVQI